MNSILLVLVGVVLGGVVGWLLVAARARAELLKSQMDAEGRVKAMEGTLQEVRARASEIQASLENRARELDELQQKLREEGEQKVRAQTALENATAAIADSNQLRERLKVEGELRVEADTKWREAQASLTEQRKLLEEAKKTLAETFQALSAEALKSNNQAFVALARSQFETLQAQAKGDLEMRQGAIDAVVQPLREALDRYDRQVQQMERTRQAAYGALDEQLRALSSVNEKLQMETGSLSTALRGGMQVRGRWGEMTLRRVAELAGMSEHCDFTEQETFTDEEGRIHRPDMIINLPGNRRIPVDAKVPLQAFIDAATASLEDDRRSHLKKHSQLVRQHLNQLAVRAYWEQFQPMPEIVVLFLPGEAFLAAALVQDPSLLEDAAEKRIILTTPTTLIALLLGVVHGWRQEQIEQNLKAISDLGKQLYDRIRTFVGHFEGIGLGLDRAIENYNKAVGSLETRVLISARKFKELGAATGEEIPQLEPVDETPRTLTPPEKELKE